MDFGSLLLLLALIIVVGAFIASPLRVRRGAAGLRQEDHEISELLAERERILESLEELDLDNAMGKVPENLYPVQREILLKRGADVLRLLDEHSSANGGQATGRDISALAVEAKEADKDDPLEAIIAARKAEMQKDSPGRAVVEEKPAAAGSQPEGKFCPNCGSKLVPGDRFCASCGTKL